MNVKNYVQFEFPSKPENVAFARSCVGAFASQLDCTLEEIEEVKLVVSEAVSNCIIHGYDGRSGEKIRMNVSILDNDGLEIVVEDFGRGIEDLEQAMKPAYSTDPGRMGLGFTFMKSFSDELDVVSEPHKGTCVRLRRSFNHRDIEGFSEGG